MSVLCLTSMFVIKVVLSGVLISFKSIDTAIDEKEDVNFSTEFSLDLPGLLQTTIFD